MHTPSICMIRHVHAIMLGMEENAKHFNTTHHRKLSAQTAICVAIPYFEQKVFRCEALT